MQLVPAISKVGGDASHESHRVVALVRVSLPLMK